MPTTKLVSTMLMIAFLMLLLPSGTSVWGCRPRYVERIPFAGGAPQDSRLDGGSGA